jgi:hypothetical protein
MHSTRSMFLPSGKYRPHDHRHTIWIRVTEISFLNLSFRFDMSFTISLAGLSPTSPRGVL